MRLNTSQKILAGFAAAAVILVVGVLAFQSARTALEAARWVAHTHEVLARLDALLGHLSDVETGQRGYVITGEPRYLEPYEAGIGRVERDYAALRRLTEDNTGQQARLDSLGPILQRRVALAREIVAARRTQGVEAAVALVASERGKRVMDDVRRRVARLQEEERDLLAARSVTEARSERRVAVVTLVGSAITFLLVALMIRVIQQDVALQQRTARERDALLAREQAARAQLAAIQRVTDAALGPLALDDLLTELMRRLREVLDVDTACVLLVMRDGEHLELCKCVGPTEEIADRVKVPVGRGVEGRIAAERRAMVVEDVTAADVFDPVVQARFASLLGAPLVVPARAIGGGAVRGDGDGSGECVIGVVHVESVLPREFTPDEVALLTLVAERAASAIERARLHQAERRSEERFRLLVEGVEDYAIFMLDPEGRIASWNAGAQRLKGYTADEIIGTSFVRFYEPDDQAQGVPERGLAAAREAGSFHATGWRVRRDGSRFWADVVITAIRDEDDGHLLGYAKVTRDLSERRRAEEALVAAKEAAEAANAAKSRFLATMSHEIRTPINAMLGYTDLLDMGLEGAVTEGQRAQLARVRASGRHLLGLVNEVLDLAKIEADQLRVERVRASASDAVATALALVYPQAAARSLAVATRCVAGADAAYLADPHRVEQVLANLLSNAVKFTPPGGRLDVACGLTERPDPRARLAGDARCWCFVRVGDTGPGIAPEHHDAVFDPFVQAGPATGAGSPYTRQHGGTGLGLTISRRLARLMGGDLTLDSAPGAGATFTLWLPAPPEEQGAAPEGASGCQPHTEWTATVADEPTVAGLARAGEALRDRVPALVAGHVARLRRALPVARGAASEAALEDHLGTLLTDVARTLVLIEQTGGASSQALRDGTEIQRVLAERHGAQRAALGWGEADLVREMELLRHEITAALRAGAADVPIGTAGPMDVDGALGVVERLLRHVARASERSRRIAAGE